MYLKTLHIEAFGGLVDFQVAALGPGLNVFYGPPGSGKSTIAQFVRAMLFGFDDETRRRLASVLSNGSGGAATIGGADGDRVITRHDDGSGDGRLTVAQPDGSLIGRRRLGDLFGDLGLSMFDRVFAVDYRRRAGIAALLSELRSQRIPLTDVGPAEERLTELRQRLLRQRDALAAMPRVDQTSEQLAARQGELAEEISRLEDLLERGRGECPSQRTELLAQIATLDSQVLHWRDELSQIDSAVRQQRERREQLSWTPAPPAAGEQFSALPESLSEQRSDPLEAARFFRNIDDAGEGQPPFRTGSEADAPARLARWQQVLGDVAARKHALQSTLDGWEPRDNRDDGDPREHLQSLEARIVELQSATANWSATFDWRQTQELLQRSLREVRTHVYGVCQGLTAWQDRVAREALAADLVHLARCEIELQREVGYLRDRLPAGDHHESGDGASDAPAAPWQDGRCRCSDHPRGAASRSVWPELTTAHPDRLAAAAQLARIGEELDVLEARAEQVTARMQQDEVELRNLRQQLKWLLEVNRPLVLEKLDAARAELRRAEQDRRRADRRRELLADIAAAEDELKRLEAVPRSAGLWSAASRCLQRLSRGELCQLDIGDDDQVWTHEAGERRAFHQLSPGARDLVYLAICLATAEYHRRRGVTPPLLISNAFTNVDARLVPAALEVLRDFAADGTQILLFTRHAHVANVCRQLAVEVRELSPLDHAEPAPSGDGDDIDAEPSWDELSGGAAACDEHVAPWIASPAVVDMDDTVLAAAVTAIDLDSAIEQAPSIDSASARLLRDRGIATIRDLLAASPAALAAHLGAAQAESVTAWQAQVRLMCHVRHLRPYDARVLAACGVTEPSQLNRLTPRDVRDMVKRLSETQNGQQVLLSGTEFELSRVTDWVDTQQSDRRTARPIATNETSNVFAHQADHEPQRSGSPSPTAPGRSRRAAAGRRGARGVVRLADEPRQLRFYLRRTDPIESAPAIGPRTAARLAAAGVRTVDDLLRADVGELQRVFQQFRVSPRTVQEWREQAELVCRVPDLRGHDAQILVAVGVHDPEQLASQQLAVLWPLVKAFRETKDGKRIIRGGNAPDEAEVQGWISAAQHARHASAA